MKKGNETKTEASYIKKGDKDLKNASFWVIKISLAKMCRL